MDLGKLLREAVVDLHLQQRIQYAVCGIVLLSSTGCNIGKWVGREKASRTETLSFDLPTSGQCNIRTYNGSIECSVGDVDQIELEATYTARAGTVAEAEADVEKVAIAYSVQGGATSLEADIPSGINGSVSMKVILPPDTGLQLQTSNGNIVASAFKNAVAAKSSNGKISLTDCDGNLNVKASNGSLFIKGDRIESLQASTSNGSVNVSGQLAVGQHEIRTSNGSVHVDVIGTPLVVTGTTSNGSMRLNGKKIQKNTPTTIGGDTTADSTDAARIKIQTSNGSIKVNYQHEPSKSDDALSI